jgi:ribosomal protein S14
MEGRAVAQAVSRWLPTAAARVRIRAACGVCGGQSGTGAGFL